MTFKENTINLIGSLRTDNTRTRIGDLVLINNQPYIRVKTKSGGYDDISASRLTEKIDFLISKIEEKE